MGKKPLVGKRRRGHAARREKAREPKMEERLKKCLLVRGKKTGAVGLELLRDLKKMKDPESSVLFSRKNDILPFEDETRMEFLCGKNDTALFVFANHNKKRPNNVVIGRIFDNQTLDIVELGVTEFTSFEEILKRTKKARTLGGQSGVIFQGDEFDKSSEMQQVRSMLLDLFRGEQKDAVDLPSFDHIVVCSAVGGKIYIRNYVIVYAPKENASGFGRVASTDVLGQKIPKIKLIDMGPSIDCVLRRVRQPSPELMKLALKQPKSTRGPKKVKNVTHDPLLGKVGRIHMKKQDMSKLVTRSRFKKALKRSEQLKEQE